MNIRGKKFRSQLAAEYVLGTLSGKARKRFEQFLIEDPALQILVDRWSAKLNPLGRTLPPIKPPKRVWRNIEKRLNLKPGSGFWSRLWVWRSLAAMASTAALIMAVFLGGYFQVEPTPVFVSVVQNDQAQSVWLISADVKQNRVVVQNLNPQTIIPEKDFELWLLPAKQQPPISIGIIQGKGDVQLVLKPPINKALHTSVGMAVSLEPRGGSPTGAPTGPVLYSGAVKSI